MDARTIVTRLGTYLRNQLDVLAIKHAGKIKDIRGKGLMLGVDLAVPCGELAMRAAEAGLLISVTADSVIRLLPPLTMTETEADEVVAILVPLVKAFLNTPKA